MPLPSPNTRPVAVWLFVVAGTILVMIALGGATRLTGSGLSIMEWAPLMGTLPPMTDGEWQRLFALYQKIPQYDLVNHGFGLEGFKRIFWLEWAHRLWGRTIGLVFLLPLMWFWRTGRLSRSLRWRLALLFVLGGLQGAIGWFMVASGFLPNTTSVSPYRLVVHLGLALILYGAIVWTGLSQLPPVARTMPVPRLFAALVRIGTACVGLTILAGGFVAGMHAGLSYNTFPLMDGRLIPAGYAEMQPFVRNMAENIAAVQFDHRLLATLTLAIAMATVATGWSVAGFRRWVAAVGAVAAMQYGLGVWTLLAVVPIDLAVAHQSGAALLLTGFLVLLHALRPDSAGRSHPV
jgi:cytochrome c oxidase assembly protein subunit 15